VSFLYENLPQSRKIAFERNVGGNFEYAFHHFTSAHVLNALLRAHCPVYDKRIWEEFLYVLSLRSEQGGWSESPNIRPMVWATYNVLTLFRSVTENFDPQGQLLKVVEAKISMETELASTQAQLERQARDYEEMSKALRQQIEELQATQSRTSEEQSKLVVLGWRNFRIYLTYSMFLLLTVLISMGYILNLSQAHNFASPAKIALFIVVFIIGYGLCHTVGRQLLKWSIESTLQIALAVAGILLTVQLAFVGLGW
jgi:hypothetical protein